MNKKKGHADKEAASKEKSVTVRDIARLAGVAPTTVSRAINHPDKVAPETLERINHAISITGFVPNLLAVALSRKGTRLIAALIPTIANLDYAETIRAFSKTLRRSNYQVILGEHDNDLDQEEELLETVLSRKPDGVLLFGTNHSNRCKQLLMATKTPVVETWGMTPNPIDSVVGFSYEQVGQTIAHYLYGKGYRNFATIFASDERAQIRHQSLLRTLAGMAGTCCDANLTVAPPTTPQLGRESFSALLDSGFRQGVVVCSSDALAQGVLIESQFRGIRIPEQIAVMGFGDQPYAAASHPALTTVSFDRHLIGEKAAELVLARIQGIPVAEKIIDVGFNIVERQTV